MHRSYALSLGSVAMAMVAVRGAMRHELASEVAVEAIIALGAFAVLGGIAGAVADYDGSLGNASSRSDVRRLRNQATMVEQ